MMEKRIVKKAIVTAGGFGTRFLPCTKSIPKEMIPILEYPTIHYVMQELVDSGITEIIVVTRKAAPATMNYFEQNVELEQYLENAGKDEILAKIKKLNSLVNVAYINQDPNLPYGSGSPILTAKHLIGDDNFAIVYCDDLVLSKIPAIQQLIEVFQEKEDSQMVVPAQRIDWDEVSKYGVLECDSDFRLSALVEKPSREEAKSNLAYYGRHVCTPKLFEYLDPQKTEEGKEFFFSECIHRMAQTEKVFVKEVEGEWLTTGDPLNMLKASVKYGLDREEYREEILQFLRGCLTQG